MQWDVFYISHEDTQPWNCWQGATVTLHLGTIPACLQRIHTIRSSKRCAWVLRQNATRIHIATWSMLLRCPSLRLVRATLSALLLCERESRDKHKERQRQNWLWQRKDFAESVRKFTAGWRPLKMEKTRECVCSLAVLHCILSLFNAAIVQI